MMMLAETKEEAFRSQKPPNTSERSIPRTSNGNDKLNAKYTICRYRGYRVCNRPPYADGTVN